MWLFLFFLVIPSIALGEMVPRRVLGFWDSKVDKTIDDCLIHLTLEMPLNYLGIDVEYVDIQKPLPDLTQRDDVKGILLGFSGATHMHDPHAFIDWAIAAIDGGKKIVIFDSPGFVANQQGVFTPVENLNRLYEKIGLTTTAQTVAFPFDYKVVYENKEYLPFERKLPESLPSFTINEVNSNVAQSLLKVGQPDQPESMSDLIVLSPFGVYIEPGFANSFNSRRTKDPARLAGWYLNPFRLFEIVFETHIAPIPDTTTLAGRRIFFSYCDGDSWNIKTAIEAYQKAEISCAEVIFEKVIRPNPDIPMTMGVIAADIDPKWVGSEYSQNVARKFFAAPQVEAATHTYSHPFSWSFFESKGNEKEIFFLHLYPYGTWQNSFLSWFRSKYYQNFKPAEYKSLKLKWGYVVPRAYANEPFNLEKEIRGSIDYLNQFAPENNKVKILLWSGDGLPWAAPIQQCYEAGIKNFGGGFNRFDPEYPSTLFVFPIGRRVDGWVQIYGCANAETNYTSEWSKRFYGFQFLPETLKNTNAPRRLKPISLYYHSYSGQFSESVDAILSNLEFIRTQASIAIHCSRYVDIAQGFYSMECEQVGSSKWKIKHRKGLQTVRFDQAENLAVDIANSVGVIGYNKYLNSLYVYLDAAVEEPIIQAAHQNRANRPYLIESNWELWNLDYNQEKMHFTTQGWGSLSMRWRLFVPGTYLITVKWAENALSKVVHSDFNELKLDWDLPYNTPIQITIASTPK